MSYTDQNSPNKIKKMIISNLPKYYANKHIPILKDLIFKKDIFEKMKTIYVNFKNTPII